MKKTVLLLGTATIALASVACSSSSDPTPVTPTTGGDGDGDTTTSTGGTPATGGDGDTAVTPTPGDGDGDGDMTPVTPGPTASTFVTSGLGESGDWSGYLWTAAAMPGDGAAVGSTIEPAEFTGSEVCASGTTGPSYEDWGMVGWNINQPVDPETFAGLDELDRDISGTAGVAVTVQNNVAGTLRIQIQNIAGTSWCADVPAGGSGTIPWADFNTECWPGGAGTDYAMEPIAQVMVQAPSASDMTSTDFDFCVISLGPG